MKGAVDPASLHEIAWRDPIFAGIDYHEWA